MLTTEQKTALKSHITDSLDLDLPLSSDGNAEIARILNEPSSPVVTVWRTSVSVEELAANAFVWSEVEALTAGKARIWEWLHQSGTINPSKSNVRQGLQDCFGAQSSTYAAIVPELKRTATRAEAVLSTADLPTIGTANTPAVLSFEGMIFAEQVEAARLS